MVLRPGLRVGRPWLRTGESSPFNENRSQSNPKEVQVAGDVHLLEIERESARPCFEAKPNLEARSSTTGIFILCAV